MGIIVDLIIIAIIVFSTFVAYKKGLISQAIKLVAVIISIIITLLLYRPVSDFIINTTTIDETIQNGIYEKSYEIMIKKDGNSEMEQSIMQQATDGTLQRTSRKLSIQIINIAVILILFFGFKLILRFVDALANSIAKLPILKKLNKIGGILYGLIRGIVIVYACLLLIGFVGKVNSANFMHKSVEESYLGKAMYENNIFNILL